MGCLLYIRGGLPFDKSLFKGYGTLERWALDPVKAFEVKIKRRVLREQFRERIVARFLEVSCLTSIVRLLFLVPDEFLCQNLWVDKAFIVEHIAVKISDAIAEQEIAAPLTQLLWFLALQLDSCVIGDDVVVDDRDDTIDQGVNKDYHNDQCVCTAVVSFETASSFVL